MKVSRRNGDTSTILEVFIQDSSSTTGAGLTALAWNTSGLTAYYHSDRSTTATAITLATMTVGTFTSGGFKEIDATNMPGWYQFCPPDAALAVASSKSVSFHLKGATNMAPLPIEIDLDTRVNVQAIVDNTPNMNGSYLQVDVEQLGTNSYEYPRTVRGATSTTIQLATAESSVDATLVGRTVKIVSNTGRGQQRSVISYTGSSRTATIAGTWTTTPDTSSIYQMGDAAPATGALKKNTSRSVVPFYMNLTSGGAGSGLTVTIQVSIDGAAFANSTNSTATEIGNGWYYWNASAADLNGNAIAMRASATGCNDTLVPILTVP